MTNSNVAYRANKTYFYQGSTVKHIEYNPNSELHVELATLIKSLQDSYGFKGREKEKQLVNKLAKLVGFESHYSRDLGRYTLGSELVVISCGPEGRIVRWNQP